MFAVADLPSRFLYRDVGAPGVCGGCTLFHMSRLKKLVDNGNWIGPEAPPLLINNTVVRPYLLGDVAFSFSENMKIIMTRIQEKNDSTV